MPRLTRKNIKVFAGSATNNGVFGSLQANNPTTTSDVEQLQSLSAWEQGWNSATETSEELPPLEEIQGVEYVTTYQQAYLMQEGIPEWASSVTYYKGSVVKEVTSTGFKIYNSLTDNNTGNLLSDTSNWKLVMDSDEVYAFDNTVVHKTGNEIITGVKTFAGDGWITYIQNTDVTYNIAPSSDKATAIIFADKNGTQMGCVECYRFTDNSTVTQLNDYGSNGNWSSQSLALRVFSDGYAVAYAPTVNSNAYGNEIATAAWVKNQGYTTSGTVFPNGTWVPVGDDAYMGDMNHSGAVCFKGNNDSTKIMLINRAQNVGLGFYIDEADNNALKLTSPTYSANAWGSVTAMTAQSLSGNGYIKFNHGLIIQWGKVEVSATTWAQVTLPTPFTSTNYSVVLSSSEVGWTTSVTHQTRNRTTTTFETMGQGTPLCWIAIGY